MSLSLNRRQFLFGTVGTLSAFVLSACGGNNGGSTTPAEDAEPVYIDEGEIDALFSNPDDFKGKWVKLPGKTLGSSQKDGEETAVQAYYDIVDYGRTYIARTTASESFHDGEYILVDGMIGGAFKGENALGGELSVPLITKATITKSSYMETVAPAKTVIEPAISVTQNDVVFTCDKVEFADAETRVHLTINNPTPETIGFSAYSICIVSDGKQINQSSSSQGAYEDPDNYPELGYEVQSGLYSSGVVVFPAMKEGKAFDIRIPDIYSDDYTIEFSDVVLEIPAS